MGNNEAHGNRMRGAICHAMVSLLEKKPFSKITVRDIMDETQIQRATFYRYFRDKYQVAEVINQTLADFIAKNFFSAFYLGRGFDEDTLLAFDIRYRPVLNKMMSLRIENVDLQKNLQEAFLQNYRNHFPDCTEYEAYLACQNFLSAVVWASEGELSPSDFKTTLLSDAQIRWLAHYFSVSPEELGEFIAQAQKKQQNP